MSVLGPLDLEPWRARIATDVTALRSVGLAADLAAAQGAFRSTPQAFVVPVADSPGAGSGPGSSTLSQQIQSTVAVVFAVANHRGASTGGESSADLQPLRRAVMDSLIGWRAPASDGAIQYAGGRLLSFEAGVVLWSDRFSTSFFLRKEYSS